MIKYFLNQYLKSALAEVFENPDRHFESSEGSDGAQSRGFFKDLFSILNAQDELVFKNLLLKPDIFNILLHPLKLVSGSVGRLKVQGLADASNGGQLKLRVDNLFLLLKVCNVDCFYRYFQNCHETAGCTGRWAI